MSSFLNYLGKGAAYGAATGGVMGLMDNDIGVAVGTLSFDVIIVAKL